MKRLLTAVLGLLVLLLVTAWGPSWSFVLLMLAVAGLGLDEFFDMVVARGFRRPGRWALLPGMAVTLAFRFDPQWIVWALAGNVLCFAIVSMASGRGTEQLESLAFATSGVLYACLLPGFILGMSRELVWTLVATVWAGDAGAYFGGRLMGRRRLAPVLSPNKTVEGAVAGAVSSTVIGTLAGTMLIGVPVALLAIACLVTGLVGQVGDLAESAMKRTAGIKDSANRLPGHGGILDRVDSLLFAAPVFQLLMLWIR